MRCEVDAPFGFGRRRKRDVVGVGDRFLQPPGDLPEPGAVGLRHERPVDDLLERHAERGDVGQPRLVERFEVLRFAHQGQALVDLPCGVGEVRLGQQAQRRPGQLLHQHHLARPGGHLAAHASDRPEQDVGQQLRRRGRALGRAGVGHGGTHVVPVGVEHRSAGVLLGAAQASVGLRRHGDEVGQVPIGGRRQPAVLVEQGVSERGDRVEQPVAHPVHGRVGDEQRLGHEGIEHLLEVGDPGHAGRGAEIEVAGEHGEATEHRLLWIRQLPVGPVDRRPEAVVAPAPLAPAGEHRDAVVEELLEIGGGERRQLGCGQLDRQR